MKVITEKHEGSKVSLDVECSSTIADEALSNAYRKVVHQVTIPGFRRGKAPRSLVERYYGSNLYEEAIQQVLPKQYIQAVEDAGVQPIGDPEFSDIHLVKGEPLRFRATVAVIPEVEFEDYDSISVEYEPPMVSEEDIEQQIETLRENMAELRPIKDDKSLEPGDYAACHVKSISHDENANDSPNFGFDRQFNYLEVGSENSEVPGLGQVLVGMKKGEVRQFESTLPLSEGEGEKASDLHFEVKVNEIYQKHLPEDIEEIAKNFGKASGEELRKDIERQLLEMRLKLSREQHTQKVEEELLAKSKFEIPDVMITMRMQVLLERLGKKLDDAGMTFENYFAMGNVSPEDFERELRQQAVNEVTSEILLDALAERENIEASESELDKVMEQFAVEMNQDPKMVKTTLEIRGALDDIKAQLRRIEALRMITSIAASNAGTPLPIVEEQGLVEEPDNVEQARVNNTNSEGEQDKNVSVETG